MKTIAIAYHPGEDLLEEIEARWRTQKQFAEILWISKYEVNDLIKGRRNITPRLAIRIWEAFGTSADVRINLQNMFDLYTISQNKAEQKEIHSIQVRVRELALA